MAAALSSRPSQSLASSDIVAASIFQLQSIPTSARLIKHPPAKTARAARQALWIPEKPSATLRHIKGNSTIIDRSALPYLLGGLLTIGSSTRKIASNHTTTSGRPSQQLPAIGPSRRSSRKGESPVPLLSVDDDPSPGGIGTSHSRCPKHCTGCSRLRDDVLSFERLHPDTLRPSDLPDEADRDTPDRDAPVSLPSLVKETSASRSNLLQTPLVPDRRSIAAATPAQQEEADLTNPLAGFLSTIELYVIQAEYRSFLQSLQQETQLPNRASVRRDMELSSSAAEVQAIGLSLGDFMALLQRLVPHVSISTPYAQRMFAPFASSTSPPRAPFRSIFMFLCRTNGRSAVIERNLRFFFSCLDERKAGRVSSRVLTHHVIKAWAENRVIGKAIFAWRTVAEAFDEARPDWSTTLSTNPAPPRDMLLGLQPGEFLVSLDELRAQVYSHKALSDAFAHHSLDCVLTDAPRYALKPAPPPGIKLSFRRSSDDRSHSPA